MNELELCLELLKTAISSDCFADLDTNQKADLVLETFQKIHKYVTEKISPCSGKISLAKNKEAKILRAYRLSAKGELDPRSETIISTFTNLQLLSSNNKLEMESIGISVSSVVEKEHKSKNLLLNSAVFLFRLENEDKFDVYVYDPNGKDFLPAPFFQLNDADELLFVVDNCHGKDC